MWACSSIGRASPLHGEGCRFDSVQVHHRKENMERTFCIIKPDAVVQSYELAILSAISCIGLRLVSIKKATMTFEQARMFYAEHKGKEFFSDLINFMVSGPCYLLILEGSKAVQQLRDAIGPTDPAKAPKNTIRGEYGNPNTIRENAIHGSDSVESAQREIAFWFAVSELD
jgi:nucleoside-diphosphate kinase